MTPIQIDIDKRIILQHLSFWLLLTSFFAFMILRYPIPPKFKAYSVLLKILNTAFCYYGMALFVFRKYWNSNWFILFLLAIIWLFIFYFLDYARYYILREEIPNSSFNFKNDFPESVYGFTLVTICSYNYFINRKNLIKLKENLAKEKYLVIKELNFLRGQFNPQITFNFLNYCYSQIHKQSKEAANAIEIYSEMLRYTIDLKPDEKVQLSDEIKYIENFIKLRKQLNPKTHIEFNHTGEFSDVYMISRILLTFIENALKHGVSTDPENPIKVNLFVRGNNLIYTVWNKINYNKKVISTGTGLENVKQTLMLHYKDAYSLSTEADMENYYVELKMDLFDKPINEKQLVA